MVYMSTKYRVQNPKTNEIVQSYDFITDDELEQALTTADDTFKQWREKSFEERAEVLRKVASRLPPALLAVLVGGALSLAGVQMQTILDNPLAEPFTLGVSSAAALGAAVAIILGLTIPGLPGVWSVSANAFLFALGALALLQLMGRLRGGGPEVLREARGAPVGDPPRETRGARPGR